VAVGIAVLQYRLYDIDLLINRTLVCGSLTAILVALYFGGILMPLRIYYCVAELTRAVLQGLLLLEAVEILCSLGNT
jgi:hypothetical protein